MNKTIRWKQRFDHFEKAFILLEKSIKIKQLSEIERGGLIQFFEISFELSWKTLKDYLEAQGILAKTPREVLKQAYQINLIENGHAWMDALDDRNLTSHVYDEAISLKMVKLIKEKYFPIIHELYNALKTEYQK